MPVPWKRVQERPPAPAPLVQGGAGLLVPGRGLPVPGGPAAPAGGQPGVWSRSKQRRPAALGGAARPGPRGPPEEGLRALCLNWNSNKL